MVTRTDALEELRNLIVRTGSAYLRNVRWIPGNTCRTCAGIPSVGFDQCYKCAGHGSNRGVADRIGFVTYGWNGGQAGHAMYTYKARGATTYELVSAVLTYAVVAHWDCIVREIGSYPDAWACVPSLSGREGRHPLASIAQRFMGAVPNLPIAVNTVADDPRAFNPEHFQAGKSNARHVLLLDDTWTTGGHFQSASAVLKQAGVQRVTGLVVARWLDPAWSTTKAFMETLTDDFDPTRCPYTGANC